MKYRDSSLDWVIIGGGIHGTHIANMLLVNGYTTNSDIRIVDPAGQLLDSWKTVTSSVGMQFLRSPGVHHIDSDSFSLFSFAEDQFCGDKCFLSPNDRPSLSLFNAHSDAVLSSSGLNSIHLQDYVSCIETGERSHRVLTSCGELYARNVLIATGQTDSLFWPDWATKALHDGADIQHVLDPGFDKSTIPESGEVVVIGGGISAVQTALSLCTERRKIRLISPHPLRLNNYDADPGWMGPKYLSSYARIKSAQKRRSVINEARNSGTITHELRHEFVQSQKKGASTFQVDLTERCSVMANNLMLLNLASGKKAGANSIILATGYSKSRPGGNLIDKLINRYSLKTSKCGYPVTDKYLQWYGRLFLSGALAELEVGPASRNIIGARIAARNLIKSFSKHAAA